MDKGDAPGLPRYLREVAELVAQGTGRHTGVSR